MEFIRLTDTNEHEILINISEITAIQINPINPSHTDIYCAYQMFRVLEDKSKIEKILMLDED